eukprot:6998819-Pyramimonas_sp.AAC.1
MTHWRSSIPRTTAGNPNCKAPHHEDVPRDGVVDFLCVSERAPEAHAHGVRQLFVDGPEISLLLTRAALDRRAPCCRVALRPIFEDGLADE